MAATETTPLSDVSFLTVAELASIMRVSKMTVYRLVHSGELEAIRVGRSFRVPEQAVNRYLRESFAAASCPRWAQAVSRARASGGYPVALACAQPIGVGPARCMPDCPCV